MHEDKPNKNIVSITQTEQDALRIPQFQHDYPHLYRELVSQNDSACPGMQQTYVLSNKSQHELELLRNELTHPSCPSYWL